MKRINFVYVCPPLDYPVGGVKVIYRHSELMMKLGYDSEVYHLEDPNLDFRCTWFTSNARTKKTRELDQDTDYLIFPDAAGVVYSNDAIKQGINYSIFVQNPYQIFPSKFDFFNENRVFDAFNNAQSIIVVSKFARDVVLNLFPEHRLKIFLIYPGIDITSFGHNHEKTNLITFMSRKLEDQADFIQYALRSSLPQSWAIQDISNLNESNVYQLLSRSKIFLSFCTKEGFGLPPLEAAYFKNIVVGYTGQGANEFFEEPIFYKIEAEDIVSFIKHTQKIVLQNAYEFNGFCDAQLKKIDRLYSSTNVKTQLRHFAESVTRELVA